MSQTKVELLSIYGTEEDVAFSAWTSSFEHQKKSKKTPEDIKKVINFLADNQHSTPFESIIFKFWIKLPIQTDRQFQTHRIQSSNGMSGRYRTMPNEWLEVPEDIIKITEKFISEIDYSNYSIICEKANNFYQDYLSSLKSAEKEGKISNNEYKRAREFFRGVLPQNNMTERVSIMNLRSWANFYKLRSSKHAQPEIQYIANEMLRLIKESGKCSETIKALEKNGWNI